MEQLLNTIAQFIQTYGIWFIAFYVAAFAVSVIVFIAAFIVIVKAFRDIDRARRR